MSLETPTGSAPHPGLPGGPFCFRSKQERSGWNVLLPIPADTIFDLAALVREVPEFLGMDGGVPCRAAVVLSEQNDTQVLAAIDDAGGICLVGYPARPERDVLTAVVRELLTQSGRLWRMPLEEFVANVETGLGRSLGEHFSGKTAEDWSETDLRAGLKQSLERGRFPVVLLLAGANKDAIEAMVHLKSHGIALKPIGVFLYESWGVEVVVPKALVIPELDSNGIAEQVKSVPQAEPPPPSTAQVANFGVPDSAQQPASTPAARMPWADLPSPGQEVAASTPAPIAKPARDGSIPDVVAGKRPPKAPDEPQPRKDQKQPKGNR